MTDLARYADNEEPRLPIKDWMRNKEVISYLGLWEQLNNKNFKGGEFAPFKNEAGSNKFKMSPQKWIKATNVRDYTDLLHLIVLNNLENINASLIKSGISQKERLMILNETARNQMSLLSDNKNIKGLEGLDKINN